MSINRVISIEETVETFDEIPEKVENLIEQVLETDNGFTVDSLTVNVVPIADANTKITVKAQLS